jgi:hypothetical protein
MAAGFMNYLTMPLGTNYAIDLTTGFYTTDCETALSVMPDIYLLIERFWVKINKEDYIVNLI